MFIEERIVARIRRRKAKQTNQIPFPALAAGGFLILSAIGFVQYLSPLAKQQREGRAAIRQAEIAAEVAAFEARQTAAAANAEAQKGNDRYRNGCIMPFVQRVDANGYFYEVLALTQGVEVIDINTGRPVGDEQLVCDDRFMTYVIKRGVTHDPARANDPDLVNQRFADYAKWHPKARRSSIVSSDT